tara:strand:+ start:583 stop:762 length:180 start_codon:yes stop_codon:yes gene_type:complete
VAMKIKWTDGPAMLYAPRNWSEERVRIIENKTTNCTGCGAPKVYVCEYCGRDKQKKERS